MTLLSDSVLRCMSEADRRTLGKAGMTAAEALAKQLLRTERQEQGLFRQWLDLNQVPYYSPRSDKRSTVAAGFC